MDLLQTCVLYSVLNFFVLVTTAGEVDQTAYIDQNAKLACSYDESIDENTLVIDWSRAVSNIPDGWTFLASGGSETSNTNADKYSVTTGQESFTIYDVTPSDAGEYKGEVYVQGESDAINTCIVNLQVVEQPPTTVSSVTQTKSGEGQQNVGQAADSSSDKDKDSASSVTPNIVLVVGALFVVKTFVL